MRRKLIKFKLISSIIRKDKFILFRLSLWARLWGKNNHLIIGPWRRKWKVWPNSKRRRLPRGRKKQRGRNKARPQQLSVNLKNKMKNQQKKMKKFSKTFSVSPTTKTKISSWRTTSIRTNWWNQSKLRISTSMVCKKLQSNNWNLLWMQQINGYHFKGIFNQSMVFWLNIGCRRESIRNVSQIESSFFQEYMELRNLDMSRW